MAMNACLLLANNQEEKNAGKATSDWSEAALGIRRGWGKVLFEKVCEV